jgi:hypothetical protein
MKEIKFIGHLITSKGLKPDPEKARDILDMPKTNQRFWCEENHRIRYFPKHVFFDFFHFQRMFVFI